MAARKKNGNGHGQDPVVELLREIRDEVRELRSDTNTRFAEVNLRFDEVNARFGEVNARFLEIHARLLEHDKVLAKLIVEIRGLNQRFDNFLTGEHRKAHEDHEARIRALEARGRKAS